MVPFRMTLTDRNRDFEVTALFNAEYFKRYEIHEASRGLSATAELLV